MDCRQDLNEQVRENNFIKNVSMVTFFLTAVFIWIGHLKETPFSDVSRHGDCLDCSCVGKPFFPVCGSDGKNYFNPCVAGCSHKNGYQYTDCTCVSNVTTTTTSAAGNYSDFTARPGFCTEECNLLTAFVASQILAAFLGTTSAIPLMISALRCVSEKDKTLSVGLSTFLHSIFGYTLGPIVFGYIVDGTCSFWHTSCSKSGSCALYDGYDLRNKIHGTGLIGRIISLLIFAIGLIRLLYMARYKNTTEDDKKGRNACTPEEAEHMMRDTQETIPPVRITTL